MVGFLLPAITLGGGASDFLVIALGAVGLSAVGTVDDRVGVGPLLRVVAELAAAVALWNADLGWSVFHSAAANLVLTLLWVVGLVNAFNLMDNIDGATGIMGMVCAGGGAGVALLDHNVLLAAFALALSGACAGFLPYNLSGPSRVFLGDGGSMPIGFVAAAAIMAAPAHVGISATAVLVAAPLVGLPILDTTLVTVSRLRRGVPVMTGGRDHITHRLLRSLGSARTTALVLGLAQAVLCGLGLVLFGATHTTIMLAAMVYVSVGAAVILALDLPYIREAVRVVDGVAASTRPAPAQQETSP